MIKNPILPGFNPDPSILRVEDDYYIATSTFEWFPGVQIHHSRDLVHWKLLTHAVTRTSQLDLLGNPNSGGVWAPCLSYCDGLFHLIYSNVKAFQSPYTDVHNYLITAETITGPWSEPIYLNSSGFDPSLFHDTDGRKWFLNQIWDHRSGKNQFAGIALQEYCPKSEKLVGPIKNIFKGTDLGVTEAPHLYKKNDYYYLMTAEGGTSWEHAVTMARSKTIDGPYTVDPQNPMLTAVHEPNLLLQKSGHASLVETQNGECYIAHLSGRPISEERRCILGRETSLQQVHWTEDGWLRLVDGGNEPRINVKAPDLPEHPFEEASHLYNFNETALPIHLNSLRVPVDESWCSLKEKPGFLCLKGRESLTSQHKQSHIARRQQAFQVRVETEIAFEPNNFQQMAGLTYFYNTKLFYSFFITEHEEHKKCLDIICMDNGEYRELLTDKIPLPDSPTVHLAIDIDHDKFQFAYSTDGQEWNEVGESLDSTIISDEYAQLNRGWFTGAYIGISCQDLSGQGQPAYFKHFHYREDTSIHSKRQAEPSSETIEVTS